MQCYRCALAVHAILLLTFGVSDLYSLYGVFFPATTRHLTVSNEKCEFLLHELTTLSQNSGQIRPERDGDACRGHPALLSQVVGQGSQAIVL